MDHKQLTAIGLKAVAEYREHQEATELFNQEKMLRAFREHRVNYNDLGSTAGYGMGDSGRDKLEAICADVFHGEDSLFRQQIVSGTHAIALALFAMVRPGDEILFYGEPYDTLYRVIGGDDGDVGTLKELGVACRIHPFGEKDTLKTAFTEATKVFYIQRSKGYSPRNALTIAEIAELIEIVRSVRRDVLIFVDNCYGEFCEEREPLEVGADLMAGSLIKNPGGGIAPGGGYLVGRATLIERAAARLTAPGIGKEVGPSLMNNRWFYQGFFNSPHVVCEVMKGGIYLGAIMEALGYEVFPTTGAPRGDIVTAIRLGNAELLKEFCQTLQRYGPVDSHVTPEPWPMPGYDDPVIMAGNGFVEGSSIELSADGPMRPPYLVFVQGGISFARIKIAVDHLLRDVWSL